MSPYENRYVDVCFTDAIPGSVTIALEEGMFLYLLKRKDFLFYLLYSFLLFIFEIFFVIYSFYHIFLQIFRNGALCVLHWDLYCCCWLPLLAVGFHFIIAVRWLLESFLLL